MTGKKKKAERFMRAENLWELAEREMALEAPKTSSEVRLVSACSELLDNLNIIHEDATRFFDNHADSDSEKNRK